MNKLLTIIASTFLLTNFSCNNNGESISDDNSKPVQSESVILIDKNDAIKFIKEFYNSFYGENTNKKDIENYVSYRIINIMDSLRSGDNLILDYDPFIKGQDYDYKTLNRTLQVQPLNNANEYSVSFILFDQSGGKKNTIDLLLEKNKDDKILISSILNDDYLNFKNENSNPNIENNQKLKLKEDDENLIISKGKSEIKLKNVIIEAMSFSTSFGVIDDNKFYLKYENNASKEKSLEIYEFFYNGNELKLISKDVIKFGQDGISDNLFQYENKQISEDYDNEKLTNLDSDIEDSYTKKPIIQNVYKNSIKVKSNEIKNISDEDYFLEKSSY